MGMKIQFKNIFRLKGKRKNIKEFINNN